MMANQFQDIKTGGDVSVQDFLKSDDLVPYNDYDTPDETKAAQIQVWDPTAAGGIGDYVTYWYWGTVYYESEVLSNTWAPDMFIYDPDAVVKFGDAVWFRTPTAAKVTVAGQVATASTCPFPTIADTWYMIANPYPTDLDINGGKIDWESSGLVPYNDYDTPDETKAAQIQVWDPTAADGIGDYVTYWYWGTVYNESDILTNTWAPDMFIYEPNATVPCGNGFWFRQPFGEVTIPFAK